jgi:hypothetical protein
VASVDICLENVWVFKIKTVIGPLSVVRYGSFSLTCVVGPGAPYLEVVCDYGEVTEVHGVMNHDGSDMMDLVLVGS